MRQRLAKLDFLGLFLWLIAASIILFAIWGTIATLQDNPYSTSTWIGFIVFGISQGSMYALIAIGYTLVYGVLFMINFAHGEFFMSGIFTATVFVAGPLAESGYMESHPIESLLAIAVVSMVVSVGVAVLTERVAYRPLRNAPRLVPLITAIGASIFWQNFFRGLFGSENKPFPQIEQLKGTISLFGIEILKTHVVVIIVTIIMLIGLNFFIMRTRTGKAIRAVAENREVAALMGIDVDRTITMTFVVGAAMAAVAGVLYAIVFRQVYFYMGFFPGLKAFIAAVLGGIGSIPGAALGGLILGLIESVGPHLFFTGLHIPAYNQLKDVISFTILVLILIFRPQGILGERLSETKA
ncbi:MAG: branched-chain amino acid ABC transporter permease [Anaerolineales bacterium]|jgi:branched-chain amino acid transport system permease protein